MHFLVKCTFLLAQPLDKRMSVKYKERFDGLTEDIEQNQSPIGVGYYPIFLLRRLCYAIFLVIFTSTPLLQLVLCFVVAIVPVHTCFHV